MTEFSIKMDDDGVFKPVVVESKTLQDGTTTQAEYDAENYIKVKMTVLDKMSKNMILKGLNIQRHMDKFRIAHDEWCQSRLKELGREEYNNETELLGGPCSCGRRMANFRILLCEYLICYHCKIHKPWHGGSLCNDPDNEQAVRLLIKNSTKKEI